MTGKPSLAAIAQLAGQELQPWQRDIIEKIASLPPGQRLIIWPPRGSRVTLPNRGAKRGVNAQPGV
jgi:hypothetical protein